MTDYKVSERTQLVTSSVSQFHISYKGYGYEGHPPRCMYEEDKRENTNCVGGEWTGDEISFIRFDSPYHNAPLIGVCAYCTLLNVNGLTSCYLSGIHSIALNKRNLLIKKYICDIVM